MGREQTIQYPTCPHCGYEFDDEEVWESRYKKSGEVHEGDGDESKLICPNPDCNKPFAVTCVHYISWEFCEEATAELLENGAG